MRILAYSVFFLLITHMVNAQNIESFGVFGGFNIPVTLDKGLEKDTRYEARFLIRGTPIGFHYGYDRPGFGWVISPSLLTLGQNYTIKNTTGGDVGTRDITLKYLSVPIALKFHVNDLSFFRLSMVAALDICYLMDGKETLTHEAAKLKFPAGVSVPTDPGYSVVYDGVFVPAVTNQVQVSKDKFSTIQLFGGVGIRADLDFSENWSAMIDGRANFGIFDSRNASYINTLTFPTGPNDINGKPGTPDVYGQRRDMFLSFTMGISRIIQTKTKFKVKQSTPVPKMQLKTVKPRKMKKR
jgi:hypothetical protein